MGLEFNVWPPGAIDRFTVIAESLVNVSGSVGDREVQQLSLMARALELPGCDDGEVAAFVSSVLKSPLVERLRATSDAATSTADAVKSTEPPDLEWSDWNEMELPAELANSKPLGLISRIHRGRIELHVSFEGGQLLRRRRGLQGGWSEWNKIRDDVVLNRLAGCGSRSGNLQGITSVGGVFTVSRDFQTSLAGDYESIGYVTPPAWLGMKTSDARAVTSVSREVGHEEVFVSFESGAVMHCGSLISVVGSGWRALKCPDSIRELASSSAGRNHEELFGLTSSDRLIHSWWSNENEWSEWADMSLPESNDYGSPTAIANHSRTPGHQELFLAYERGPVFHKWRWNDSRWSDWHVFSASKQVRAITSCGASPEHQEVFSITADRRLVHATYGPA